ncbi:tetratricopeptide repeat protein [Lacticaseibacillus hulanensis]|uniref:tetratricopeptide repeat protein n=1 Tax=Lacticaseibacillus hulanensis TaxID=2493111 RepID=UPI000FD8E267|nr:tetratricopeptide repeat protein [Lacticaseibacillus hulanensis]
MEYAKQMLDALEKGNMDQARELFKQVLANEDDETKFNLAEELYAMGFTGQAKRLYQELLGNYPDDGDVLTALADIAVSDGDTDQALTLLDRVKPDNPAYVQALIAAADVYQSQGLYEVSLQKLTDARKLDPDEPVIIFALGELQYDWGHYSQAAAAYLELLDGGEENIAGVNVRLRYAESLAQTGRFEDAISVYQEVGEDSLPIADRFQIGGLYMQVEEFQRASDAFSAVLEADESYTNAYLPLAQAQRQLGQPEAALVTIQTGLAHDDTNPELYSVGAELALAQEDSETGERYLRGALKLEPDNQHYVLAWSNFLLHEHRDQENIDYLGDLDASGESDPQLYWNLARSEENVEDYEKARSNYLLAFRTFQDRPEFLREIAEFFRTTGAKAEETAALTRLTSLQPDDFDAQDRLGELKDES